MSTAREHDTPRSSSYLARRLARQAAQVDLTPSPAFPRSLMFELSNACNHACRFCYSRHMQRRRGTADDGLVRRIMAEAHALGAREVGFATTGEAVINRRLFDYVALATALGYDYSYFSTNGALLDDDAVERIFSSGLSSIKFSINAGTAATYAAVHGHDHFDQVIARVEEIDRLRRRRGSRLKLLVTSIQTAGNTSEQSREQELLRARLGGVVDDLAFYPETAAVGPTNGMNTPLPCTMIFNRLHVSCEGYLSACCVDYENNLVTADLNTTPLAEAWRSPAFQELRRRHLSGDLGGTLCQVCVSRKMQPYRPLTTIGRGKVEVPAAARHILVLLTSSLGEVDWLLPVLTRLAQQGAESRRNARLIAMVIEPQLQQKLAASSFYRERLSAVAEVLHHGRDYLSHLSHPAQHYRPEDIGLILKSDDPDNAVTMQYRQLLPHAPVALFPSGTAILTMADDPDAHVDDFFRAATARLGSDPRRDYQPSELCLVGTPHMLPYYRNAVRCAELQASGTPRYDIWWTAAQLADPDLATSEEARFADAHDETALLILRGPHWLYQAPADYDALMKALAAAIATRPRLGVIIKAHPRQDQTELAARLADWPTDQLLISTRPLQQLAHLVDLTVSMFSSGVLDALSVGTPVVEFYRYHERAPVLEFRRDATGRLVSIYEALGLVTNLASDGIDEGQRRLERFLHEFFDLGMYRDLARRRQAAFRSASAVGEDSSTAVADALLALLDRGRSMKQAEPATEEAIHA